MLTALNNSNVVANLLTLHLGDYYNTYCDLSGEGASDLLWAILQKAHNLRQLQLPKYIDIYFIKGGVSISSISEQSKQFITFLSKHSSLCKHMPWFSTGDKQLDGEWFALVLECINNTTMLNELYMYDAKLSGE